MHEYKYHIIHKTTNLINGKIYVGMHSTDNLNDGYLGMGVENQWGENNPAYGKVANNAKGVLAEHLDGRQLKFNSIQECADTLGFARGNIRNLLYKGIRGRRGWKISYC